MRYLELDAGSRASAPHTYIVPLAVIANHGIPAGLTLAPGKRVVSYKLFSNHFFDMNPWLTKIVEYLLLPTDAGIAVGSFARLCSRHHYFCYCHLVENLQAKTLVSILARKVLFAGSRKESEELRPATCQKFRRAYEASQ
jgi:hypothetical protein